MDKPVIDTQRWVRQFRATHGRAPKILHIGNIANNAYLNAKFLREFGVEADVLCYDYYHLMGCPEWEDGNITGAFGDEFAPEWYKEPDLDFVRPTWFVQGPFVQCLEYLIAKHQGDVDKTERLWRLLSQANKTVAPAPGSGSAMKRTSRLVVRSHGKVRKLLDRLMYDPQLAAWLATKLTTQTWTQTFVRDITSRAIFGGMLLASIPFRMVGRIKLRLARPVAQVQGSEQVMPDILGPYIKKYPDIKFPVTENDWIGYLSIMPQLQAALEPYDVVQGYSTDGIIPLLCGKRYAAFEHGTIRQIPFEDTVQGRLCAMSYRMAHAVLITNADNLLAANRLELRNFTFVPHPVNPDRRDVSRGSSTVTLREQLMQEMDTDFIIFHPARQHWEDCRHPNWEKGNDFLINGFARFVKEVNPKASAVFVEWGKCVDKSKALIESLGITDRIRWVKPMAHQHMVQYVNATDVLADQFYLGAFGTTMPKALMLGKPALIYLNEELHRWCFPQLPPVINSRDADDIFNALSRLHTDPEFKRQIAHDGKAWYDQWHSKERVVQILTGVYQEILSQADGV